ncbi:MAG: hypothetical protein LBI39_03520, partial [Puniceicoccales bacterium]|nr:hypothetical protein [Puniceicoccales bacterium]
MESLKPDARFIGRISEALERGRMARSVILFGHSPKCLELTIAAAAKILVGGELLNTFAVWPTGKSRQISLAAIRAVLGKLHLSSLGGGRRVALIHGADRLHQSAANAMLKTLEEPPDGAFFLLSARRRCDVLGTIASR